MGTTQSDVNRNIAFDPKIYVQQEIDEKDVLNIYLLFESFKPHHGRIQKVSQIKEFYKRSYEKQNLDNLFQNDEISFDEFFQLISQYMKKQQNKFGGSIQFDLETSQPDLLLCPCSSSKHRCR